MACIKINEFCYVPSTPVNNRDYGLSFQLIIDECKRKFNNLFFWNTFDIYSYKNPHVVDIMNHMFSNKIPSDISMIIIEYMGLEGFPVPYIQMSYNISINQVKDFPLYHRWENVPELATEFEKMIKYIYVSILKDRSITDKLIKHNRVHPSVHINETYDLLAIMIIQVIKNIELITNRSERLETFCKNHIEKYEDSLYYQHMWDIENENKLRYYKISEFDRITPNKYTSIFEDEHNILRMIYHLFMHNKYFVYNDGKVVSINQKIYQHRGKRDPIMKKLLNLSSVDDMFKWLTWYQKLIYVKITAMREKGTYNLLKNNSKIELTKYMFDNICDEYWYNFDIYDIYDILDNIQTLFCVMSAKYFGLKRFELSEHCYDFHKVYTSFWFYQLPGKKYKPMKMKKTKIIKKSEILQDMQFIINKLGLFEMNYTHIESVLCINSDKIEQRTGRINYSEEQCVKSYYRITPTEHLE
jgi:hypothetical protein